MKMPSRSPFLNSLFLMVTAGDARVWLPLPPKTHLGVLDRWCQT